MTERYLITRVKKSQTTTGKTVVDLYSRRLEFPVLRLFELAELADVGIDHTQLDGQEMHVKFWAYYQESEKTNGRGNPYKDVLYLEPTDGQDTGDDPDLLDALQTLIDETRAIKALLQQIVGQTAAPDPAPAPADPNAHLAHLLHKPDPTAPPPDPNPDADHFFTLSAQAAADGLDQATIDQILTQIAGNHGFPLAAQCLAAEMKRKPGDELEYRRSVIARMHQVLAAPQVAAGLVQPDLEPGWQWLTKTDALVKEGKRLLAAIQSHGDDD